MKEAKFEKIIGIMMSADGGCIFCARNLCQQLANTFPENTLFIKQKFYMRFKEDLYI